MKNQLSLGSLFSLFTVVAASSTATPAAFAATDGEAPTTLVAAPAVPAPAAAADPNIDRGFIQPTAMTQPAGSLTYNNYELLLHGLTYGVTDHLQTSLTVLSPIVKEMPLFAAGSVKWQFLSTPRFHLALQGSASVVHVSTDSLDTGSATAYMVGAGAFASVCLRDDCSSLASVNATYQLALAGAGDDTAHLVVYGGSIVHRISPHFKLLGEVTSLAARGSSNGSRFDNAPGALVSYGVRFHTATIASDVGFMKPVFGDDDAFLLGLPFINVSYRWQ
jgi:hypothetical protein